MSNANDDGYRHPRWRWHVPSADELALGAFTLIAIGVTVIAVVESYTNLLGYFLAHNVHGWRAIIAPGAVDSFIVMGELLVFITLRRNWDRTLLNVGIGAAVWGFILSVGGNVWHSASASITDHAVSAIWPVTAAAGMAGALMIVKRVTAGHRRTVTRASRTAGSKAREPQNEIPEASGGEVSQSEAQVQVPAVRRPRGAAPKQFEMTPELVADLDAGLSARELDRKYPELSRWTAGRLVKAHQERAQTATSAADDTETVTGNNSFTGNADG